MEDFIIFDESPFSSRFEMEGICDLLNESEFIKWFIGQLRVELRDRLPTILKIMMERHRERNLYFMFASMPKGIGMSHAGICLDKTIENEFDFIPVFSVGDCLQKIEKMKIMKEEKK